MQVEVMGKSYEFDDMDVAVRNTKGGKLIELTYEDVCKITLNNEDSERLIGTVASFLDILRNPVCQP